MTAEYAITFLRELEQHIPDVDLKTAMYLAEVGFEQSPDGNAAEDVRDEVEEWRLAS